MSIARHAKSRRVTAGTRQTSLWLVVVLIACVAALGPDAKAQTQAVPQNRAEISLSFAPIVKQAAPAVVNVYSRRVVRRRSFGFLGSTPSAYSIAPLVQRRRSRRICLWSWNSSSRIFSPGRRPMMRISMSS